MRKIVIMLLACLVAVCLFSACGEPEGTTVSQDTTDSAPVVSTTPVSTTEAPEDDLPKPLPAEGVLSYRQDGESITVTVTLAPCAGETVSLLLLKDLRYQYAWVENPDAYLCDLGQLTLTETGEGCLMLTPKDTESPMHLLLSTSGGNYAMEVILK